ncbi:MAG TPA: hypothetical protein VMZ53_16150 [Kofleriaceae bacterium]|nr:hypothetical protein [Kofleriaceae bacterium]
MSRFFALALLLSGCDMLFQLDHLRVTADAPDAMIVRPDGALPEWSQPTPLTGLNAPNTSAKYPYDSDASMTRDGLEIFFSSDRGNASGQFDIYHATRASVTASFGAPTVVTELSTSSGEAGQVNADGTELYFTRMGNNGVFKSTRPSGGTWSNPTKTTIMPTIDVGNPAISGDGLQFVVNARVGTSDNDLYVLSRETQMDPWGPERHVVEVASTSEDGAGCLDQDGLVMFFHTERMAGVRQIYETTRPNVADAFLFTSTYPAFEGDSTGSDPWISADRRTMVFSRDGDLYISTR